LVAHQSIQYSTKDGWERVNVTPDAFNRHELVRVEDRYHDDDSRIHMLWGTELDNDQPKTRLDGHLSYGNATGIARHTGSPNSHHVYLAEGNDFGIMIARDRFAKDQFQGLQSVGMHELGHALSIGWRDDAPLPHDQAEQVASKAYEVYSGNRNEPNLTGGLDPTPEGILTNHNQFHEWSIMREGTAKNSSQFTATSADFPVLLFSIEELSTADFKHIPSKEEE
jgi:hypothetical protein